jgi:hypothetical protein
MTRELLDKILKLLNEEKSARTPEKLGALRAAQVIIEADSLVHRINT